jgi:hypothetical protein
MKKPVCSNQERARNFCTIASFILKGMPRNHATNFAVREVLRKAVTYSCPGYKGGDSKRNVKYVSLEAERALQDRAGAREVDHVVPQGILIKRVYEERIYEIESLMQLVSDPPYSVTALITKAEHQKLSGKLKKAMPAGWDGQDDLARYKQVGIRLKAVEEIPDFQAVVAQPVLGRLTLHPD